MDQNVVRTDLLPESLAFWMLVVFALLGVGAWVLCHWLVKRHAANRLGVWLRALAGVPVGVIASWLVLQAISRYVFLATPWSLFFAAVLAAVSLEAVSAFYAHEVARVPRRTGRLLVALRMAAVVTALMVLFQPVVVGERARTVDRRVVVLVDDSASMHFKDRLLTAEERQDLVAALGLTSYPEAGMTRAEMVQDLVATGGKESYLRRLGLKYRVDVFRFGGDVQADETLFAPGSDVLRARHADDAREVNFRSVTDMSKALERVVREVPVEEIAGILVFSDGRHNGEAGVEAIARKLGASGIGVSTVLVGGSQRPFDLAIAEATCRESVFLGDKVRFTVRLTAGHANGRKATVQLKRDDEVVDSREFTVEGDSWSHEYRFADVPAEKGVYRYRVEVSNLDGELFAANNARELDVAVSDDRTNVLLVDLRPRWEYRYLRNLFYGRDKSVHLQDYLVRPDAIAGLENAATLPPASASRPFGESEAGGLPTSPEEWRKFDVIILGDLGEDVLTPEVVENVRAAVVDRGALLVVISGSEHMPLSIRNEAFRALLPVEYQSDDASHRRAVEDGFTFALTAQGRGHPVMNQSASQAESEAIWDNLPEFRWRLPVDGVKPGAEVLAWARPLHSGVTYDVGAARAAQSIAAAVEEDPEEAMRQIDEMRGEEGRKSLIVSSACGRGRVLMLNTDSMWRLRSKQGDEVHHRFWGQVMRWGAGEKLRAGNEYVRLGTDQLRYGAGESVKAFVRISEGHGAAVEDLSPRLVVRPAEGQGKARAFSPELRRGSNGYYDCDLGADYAPGTYVLALECDQAARRLGEKYPAELSTRFTVVSAKRPAEEIDVSATREFVSRMAAATGGSVITPGEYVRLTDDFGVGSKQVADRVEFQLWSLPPLFVLLVILLGAEWILRKRSALA